MASWREVSKGHYERPLGANERFIKFVGDRAHIAGREQWSVSVVATLRFPDKISPADLKRSLQYAWRLFRFKHPSIASTVIDDGNDAVVKYNVPDSKILDDWANETFFVIDDSATSAEDTISVMKPNEFLTGYFLSHRQEIIIHTAHWRTDGYGAIYLLDAFLHAIKTVLDNDGPPSVPWGEEVSRLVPSLETALQLPDSDPPEALVAAKQYISTQGLMKNSVGIHYLGDMETRPGGTRSVTMQIPKETTQTLEAACEAGNLELFAACHAALAKFHFSQPTKLSESERCYSSTIRLSMRPHLLPPYNDSAGACSIYTGGYRFQVSSSESFSHIAGRYLQEYKNGVTDSFIQSRRQFAMTILESLRGGMPIPNPPPSNIDISIVDDAERMISPILSTKNGPLEVLNINLGVETLTRQPYLFLWKFSGQLNLALWYNEAYQDAGIASEALRSISHVLGAELGLVM
ncbi:uncharacterized protein TRUGW13939_02415 [Talaromyces rugulosus]|uniref:Condensation domain-containing protein n=1 Tax=Talaromyces rugulosus TaxID=121627 RepID=A0A7H8QQ93_TALRU|nr:uncharacterized protein TRUGW13939_02415 [Talaromyces rugulosus]QKX55323.1 hypothetical protein TRUGW13939_02415 [Talaromyces rugulosus]